MKFFKTQKSEGSGPSETADMLPPETPCSLESEEAEPVDPNLREYRYVFIGGGVAAGYFAHTLEAAGLRPGELVIISGEEVPPYERPAINKKYLTDQSVFPKLLTCAARGDPHNVKWYAEHGIDLVLSTLVTSFDAETKTAIANNDLKYRATEAVIIGTGCRPRYIPVVNMNSDQKLENSGGNHEGLFHIYGQADSLAISKFIEAKQPKTAVVVGSGYLGMEMAAFLCTQGIEVTVVSKRDRVFMDTLPACLANRYQQMFEEKGVKFCFNRRIKAAAIERGSFHGFKVDGGDTVLAGDMGMVCIGSTPNLAPFMTCPAVLPRRFQKRGIPVDGALETNVPGVFAVGDICIHPLMQFGKGTELTQHVSHARNSAMFVANFLAGVKVNKNITRPVYDYHPHFYSMSFTSSWKMWGDLTYDQSIIRGNVGDTMLAVFLWEGRVLGAFLEGGKRSETILLEAVSLQQARLDVDMAHATKTAYELMEVVAEAIDENVMVGGPRRVM